MTPDEKAAIRARDAGPRPYPPLGVYLPKITKWMDHADRDRQRLLAEVDRLEAELGKSPPLPPGDGWARFGTHAACPGVRLEFSGEEESDDGLPIWERVVVEAEAEELWGET